MQPRKLIQPTVLCRQPEHTRTNKNLNDIHYISSTYTATFARFIQKKNERKNTKIIPLLFISLWISRVLLFCQILFHENIMNV